MTKQGVVLLPIYLGTVGKIEIDEKGYFVTDEMMENLYFNLKASMILILEINISYTWFGIGLHSFS